MPKRPQSSRTPSSFGWPTDRPARRALIALLRGYRVLVSPVLGPACRFAPSCSAYAIEAVERHGAARGTLLAVRRLTRCHPWHPGGYDPVPGGEG